MIRYSQLPKILQDAVREHAINEDGIEHFEYSVKLDKTISAFFIFSDYTDYEWFKIYHSTPKELKAKYRE